MSQPRLLAQPVLMWGGQELVWHLSDQRLDHVAAHGASVRCKAGIKVPFMYVWGEDVKAPLPGVQKL
jgi:hypothetical protein